jgi:hypothetical protein
VKRPEAWDNQNTTHKKSTPDSHKKHIHTPNTHNTDTYQPHDTPPPQPTKRLQEDLDIPALIFRVDGVVYLYRHEPPITRGILLDYNIPTDSNSNDLDTCSPVILFYFFLIAITCFFHFFALSLCSSLCFMPSYILKAYIPLSYVLFCDKLSLCLLFD